MASRVVEESDQQQQQHLSMSMPINALVGFRFTPTDIELIEGYLKKRISSSSSLLPEADGFIVDFDIYSCNPWELPRHHFRYPSQQREMYFFTPTRPPNSSSKSSSSSSRCARTAGCGVWHGNGQDHRIVKNGVVIGHTTAFKFEMIEPAAVDAGAEREKGSNKRSNRNRNSNGRRKTDWLMHEYRLTSTHALVLCKIYENKSTAAAASCRKQQENQDQDQEVEEPVSVQPFAAAMPQWIVQAYSDAPDHIIRVPNLMMQQQQYQQQYHQHLLTKKRRRVEMEEEPSIIPPLASMPASSSEITFMASAALPLPAQQQQRQQVANFADFANSLEQQQPLEQDADSAEQQPEQVANLANSLKQQLLEQVPARLMPDEAAFLSPLQNMPELPSLPLPEEQQKEHQDQQEEQVSVRPLPAAMPSWIVQAYSDAPDRIIQVPNLMVQQQQHLLTKKRRRVEVEEEPAIIPPLAAMPASSSEITFMASATLPLPAWRRRQQQQQHQQEEDANCADFSDSLEQQLLEQDAGFAEQQLLEQDANFANSVEQQLLEQVPARSMMPDEATLLSSLQNMPELPSLPWLEEQQKGNVDSLLSQIWFDDEPGSLPPLDFTIPEDVLSMTAEEFLSGLKDCPF